MAYIRNNLNASHADLQRCAGRCEIAAKKADDAGNVFTATYLAGAAGAIRSLMRMEEGHDEETFLTFMLNEMTSSTTDGADA